MDSGLGLSCGRCSSGRCHMVNFPSPRALCDKRLQGVESQLDTAHVERFLISVRLSQLVSWFNPEDNCNCWIWSAPAPHGCCTQCVCGPCLSSRGPTILPDVKLRNIDSLNWPPPIVPGDVAGRGSVHAVGCGGAAFILFAA